MARNAFLGEMLSTLFEHRGKLSQKRVKGSIQGMCTALLTDMGEVSGIVLAESILQRYSEMSLEEKRSFFEFLNDELELDVDALRLASEAYARSPSLAEYQALVSAAEPPRQELLRRLNQPSGATAQLVGMRSDLLDFLKKNPELKRIEMDFAHLLRSWFNRGFLVLRQITWDTPASILEKIVAYEAVHAINDWDDLRRRLHPPDRRCFAYFHPAMPEEPLIFVEVALTRSIPDSIQHVLSEDRELRDAQETSVAVFYSISNCQTGLAGISFGNLLIKQVVGELSSELPNLKTFVTLSPIPRLKQWLEASIDFENSDLNAGQVTPDDVSEGLAAYYLLNAKNARDEPFDPVARFHLGNGAKIHAVHAKADTTKKGQGQSNGVMVNYLYDLGQIERNHEAFIAKGEIAAEKSVKSRGDLAGLKLKVRADKAPRKQE